MSDDLKPCPFCGGNAKRYYRADDSGWENTDWVGCTDGCGASTACYETKALAVTVWNTRIDTDDMADRIKKLELEVETWKSRAIHQNEVAGRLEAKLSESEALLAKAVGLIDDMIEWGTWYGLALSEILQRRAELKGEK